MKNAKFVALVAAGVIAAGLIMQYGRGSIAILKEAHDGFDGLG